MGRAALTELTCNSTNALPWTQSDAKVPHASQRMAYARIDCRVELKGPQGPPRGVLPMKLQVRFGRLWALARPASLDH